MMKDTRDKALMGKVRTRVAPSPTGFPHVGTALQALFDWVYARRYQGQFILRLEDTDQKRYVAGSEKVIFEALDWLDLTPDESSQVGGEYGPYRQSERLEIYQRYAQQLVEQKKAYHCFCSTERLAAMRQKQQKAGQPPKYDGHCLALGEEQVKERLEKGEKSVIRLKVPAGQRIVVQDAIRGEVVFDSGAVDDQVLLKSDGFPTYHLAVVVDDHLMKITHMKRGEEWLSSAPKHVLLYQFLGWKPPVMIHMPTLRNPDRSKLSKRKGNTSLWWYREQGFLKEALLNFLALIIWKNPLHKEIFSKEDLIEVFEWDQINIAGPIFDVTKLTWLNGIYIRQLSTDELLTQVKAWASWVSTNGREEDHIRGAKDLLGWIDDQLSLFTKALELAQERLKTISQLPQLLAFYFTNSLDYNEKDLSQKQTNQLMAEVLLVVKNRLEQMKQWDHQIWETTIRQIADDFELKHSILFMSLRSAVTARNATPPLFAVMQALGTETALSRIQDAIDYLINQRSS